MYLGGYIWPAFINLTIYISQRHLIKRHLTCTSQNPASFQILIAFHMHITGLPKGLSTKDHILVSYFIDGKDNLNKNKGMFTSLLVQQSCLYTTTNVTEAVQHLFSFLLWLGTNCWWLGTGPLRPTLGYATSTAMVLQVRTGFAVHVRHETSSNPLKTSAVHASSTPLRTSAVRDQCRTCTAKPVLTWRTIAVPVA